MKFSHRRAVVAGLAVTLVIAAAIVSRRPITAEHQFERVSDRLLCQCGCGQHLNGCNMHPCGSAYPMRDQIRAGLAGGKSEDQIVQEIVQQIGAVVLAAPPASGVGLAAWIMPIVALLGGLYVIYRVLNLRGRPAPATAGAAPAKFARDPALQRYADSIEKDLERDA